MKSKMKLFLLTVLFSFLLFTGMAQEIAVIPAPVKIQTESKGTFQLRNRAVIVFDSTLQNSADFLRDYCSAYYGISLKSGSKPDTKHEIRLAVEKDFEAGQYVLEINKNGINIKGSEDGVFYGIQSLVQLLPLSENNQKNTVYLPFVAIEDRPRFQYRGIMLDVARYFFDLRFLKKCVDYAALHKMNYFHLHLTDDQGWRIEIKKYPHLTEVGSWRNGTIIGLYPGTGNDGKRHGGFYTQDEIRELVDYAQKKYITIVPEIEMPGHALGALTAYPALGCTGGPYSVKEIWGISDDVFCAGNDSVFIFIQDILDEVITLFPSQYIHIGGDECPKVRWEKCPKCQARIQAENLKDEHELQSYFITRIDNYLAAKGRTVIGWDEILEGGISPNATIMSWRGNGEFGCLGAAHAKHPVIMTPSFGFYLDYPQTSAEDSLAANWGGVTSMNKTYHIDPVIDKLTAEEAKYVIGGQANIWTEYMNNPRKVEYMTFPRLSAVSEVLWSPKEKRNWESFKNRLQSQYKRYQLWGTQYNPANPDAE
jgi:hexosaminidase